MKSVKIFEKFKVTMNGSNKEVAIDDLCNSLVRDKPLKLTSIEEIESEFSPDEMTRSFDIIALLKLRSLTAEGKYYRAYQVLNSALKKEPKNICLQIEYGSCIQQLHQHLLTLLHDDPSDSRIELFYTTLKNEAAINPESSTLFIRHLLDAMRINEAVNIALPLIQYCPAQKGLRTTVELLVQHAQHPLLLEYLRSVPPKPEVKFIKKSYSAGETYKLVQSFREIQKNLINPDEQFLAEQALKKIIISFVKIRQPLMWALELH